MYLIIKIKEYILGYDVFCNILTKWPLNNLTVFQVLYETIFIIISTIALPQNFYYGSCLALGNLVKI